MIRKYIIVADDSIKGFDNEIARLEREWGAEEIEPCEDCINRKEASHFLCERLERLNDDELYDIFSRIIDDMYNELPSVTPARPKGYWIERTFPYMIHDYKCSECGKTIEAIAKSNFCPNCGADMRGDSE